ncbi:hypothetical protein [Carboxylicivirga sp. M1479]|uniref:hypothetical protein n=1 Tax=Carboxylicivirga sp. M1479 TaxID=2594476 RepID=UPI001177BAD5|nr:hypothetical protein [Carboxylicivirga sp. M1479]TRX66492.1 hypothetical protein FNN09_13345 [Carboxylicivirga sp. M1479]
MKNLGITLVLSTLILIACGPNHEELAKNKFNKAEQLFSQKKFNDAKLEIDSIEYLYPNQIEYITRGNDLLRKISIEEQNQNLVFLDSMLQVKEMELVPLMKNFTESSDYGTKKILIHKRQKPENSYGRIYLRAHLNLEGDFYISSRYTGTERIHHDQIKVYFNKNSVLSEEVPEDGVNNRHLEDGENHWEVISYKNGKDNGVIDFIANNANQSLKVQFRGKKYYYIVMEKFDKEAIRDGYEISFVLKEIKHIKEEIKTVKAELKRLNA